MPSYRQASRQLSGKRFSVEYSFFGSEKEARINAESTCVEQTIEFPPELLPDNRYWRSIQGCLEHFERTSEGHFRARISYAAETTSLDIVQILNVIYGNIAMIRGIRVEDVTFPAEMLAAFKGPRFGLEGVRNLSGSYARPLICATIKPMGLAMESFEEIAYEAALGGADIVKDDHGLTDQSFAKFESRVARCAQAILKANAETGENCLYAPNVSAPIDQIASRAHFAKRAGAQAQLIIPGLVGWDAVRMLSEDDGLALPIICHPSYFGLYFMSDQAGFSAKFAYGVLPRLVGGDVSILPNYIGRLYATSQDCRDAVSAAKRDMGGLKPVFPAPGGGITLETIPELLQFYDDDVIYVMGGGLHRNYTLKENCRSFRDMIETK